jgi:hypothetical protein
MKTGIWQAPHYRWEPHWLIFVKAGFDYGGDLAVAVIEVKKHEGLTALDWD